jgi:hypothetical protein
MSQHFSASVSLLARAEVRALPMRDRAELALMLTAAQIRG